MPRGGCGLLAALFGAFVLAGCANSSNPVRPDQLEGSLPIPTFLLPSFDLIDRGIVPTPEATPYLERSAGEWIRQRVRGVEVDPSVPAAVVARCCDADGVVRWSAAWIPDVGSPEDVVLAATILVTVVMQAYGVDAGASIDLAH